MIAFLSTGYGLSKKAANLFPLEQDEEKRAEYMKEAITLKFDNNPDLRKALKNTRPREVIEYTFWKDDFF